ncbi:DUF2935 domain-containing protein [Paenibacillus sp. KQZ6P-2]|uniref:DUF2935 domain-containing protein n=1 Tax=Paenibacillus mangrovi TaxID=2931978 RepID=A0A9X1WJ01_9BACL|nr:DUF2935 domain-containing protein [Paenibacillus mangrovi]MCJ8010252.1 DUF2935 domain-containing protein [Paenibacillus mangrovi]
MEEALFEHRFWLQILGDHARFIYNALSSTEAEDVRTAEQFIVWFDQLLDQARTIQQAGALNELNEQAYQAVLKLHAFKLRLLDRLLLGKVVIAMSPTFINHMLNELEEYERILTELRSGKPVPYYHPLHHDLLWLPDAVFHSAAIASDLDGVERRLIYKSKEFEQHFNEFYLKALELVGYLRTLKTTYPSIKKFHQDVDLEMAAFMAFLLEVEELDISAELLSRLNRLVPDHMYREECYYLQKLSQFGEVPKPDCDPTKPRVQ